MKKPMLISLAAATLTAGAGVFAADPASTSHVGLGMIQLVDRAAGTATVAQEPILRYVHGMSFTPDGKTLVIPKHAGLAAYREGRWSQVYGPAHEFTGYIATADAIYASGHPAPGFGLQRQMGLIISTDGGLIWRQLALEGESAFDIMAVGYWSNTLYVVNPAPNSLMRAPGIYWTRDDGKTWRRAAAQGLDGQILSLAAHPREAATLAVATSMGLFLSRDAGEHFQPLDDTQTATTAAFDFDAKRLHYVRGDSRELLTMTLDDRTTSEVKLPELGADLVAYLAQSPADARIFAFATRWRNVFLSTDAGATWRQIAEEGYWP